MAVINPKVKDTNLARVLHLIASGKQSPQGLYVNTPNGRLPVTSVKEVAPGVYHLIPKLG